MYKTVGESLQEETEYRTQYTDNFRCRVELGVKYMISSLYLEFLLKMIRSTSVHGIQLSYT